MPTASLNIRIDSNVKKQTQKLFSALGMDMTTAINVFLRKAIQPLGMPFEVVLDRLPPETLEAFAEVQDMKKHPDRYKGYTDVDDMMKELLA